MMDPCLYHSSLTMIYHGQLKSNLTFMVDHGQTMVISLQNQGRPWLVSNHGKTIVEHGLSMVLSPGSRGDRLKSKAFRWFYTPSPLQAVLYVIRMNNVKGMLVDLFNIQWNLYLTKGQGTDNICSL